MKKEWIMWGVIGLLAVALIIGVIALTSAVNNISVPPSETDPTIATTTQGTEESTVPMDDTTVPGEQTTAPEETTLPNGEKETTESTEQTEDGAGPATDPTEESEENGFGERDPVKPTDPTKPKDEPTEPTTKPSQEETTPTTQPESTTPTTKEEMTFRDYEAMTTEEQLAFANTFPSRSDFLNWYKEKKKEYEDSQKEVIMGPGNSIDIGELIGGKQP